jgi:predicted DCC family thiol-disulfide oxidoreductase YuxK
MMAPVLTVLYDDDCGVCRWSADRVRIWDRRGRLAFGAIQRADDLLTPIEPGRRLEAMHVVERDGRVWSGGAAVTRLATELPGGAPVAWAGRHAPVLTERAYRWVAAHRERIGSWLGADRCTVDPSATR